MYVLEEPSIEDDFDGWAAWFERLKACRDELQAIARSSSADSSLSHRSQPPLRSSSSFTGLSISATGAVLFAGVHDAARGAHLAYRLEGRRTSYPERGFRKQP